jgi:hypothetical protein
MNVEYPWTRASGGSVAALQWATFAGIGARLRPRAVVASQDQALRVAVAGEMLAARHAGAYTAMIPSAQNTTAPATR